MTEEEEDLEVEEVAAVAEEAEAAKEDIVEVAMEAMAAKEAMEAMAVMAVKEVIIKDKMEIIAKAIINKMTINQIEEDTKDQEDIINLATVEIEVEEVAFRNNREEDTRTKTRTNNDLVLS